MPVQTPIAGSAVVLTGTVDYDDWYTVIQAMARGEEIWDYVNPETASDLRPKVEPPVEPKVTDVDPNAVSLRYMTASQREEYMLLYQIYLREDDQYRVLKKALAKFPAKIIKGLSSSILSHIRGCTTAYDILVRLQSRFEPTDKVRKQYAVLKRYRKLLKAPEPENIKVWLDRWEKIYDDGVQIDLPSVTGKRAVKDFIRTLEADDLTFETYWARHLENTDEYSDLPTLIEDFRTSLRKSFTTVDDAQQA